MTIIITTHYIEESRGADSLAFMRFGRILAQDSPDTLLAAFNCTILEDVFLRLCQQDCGDIKEKYSIKKKRPNGEPTLAAVAASDSVVEEIESSSFDAWPTNDGQSKAGPLLDMLRMRALIFKNVLNLKRNPYVVLFFLVLPVIQITLFCYSVFKNPDNLQISVYNGEDGKGNSGLSKQFLNSLDRSLLDVSASWAEMLDWVKLTTLITTGAILQKSGRGHSDGGGWKGVVCSRYRLQFHSSLSETSSQPLRA